MPENAAHEARISSLEKHYDAMTSAMSSLAVEMRKLAEAIIRLDEDRAALARAFAQIEKVQKHSEQNESRIEQIETDRLKATIESQQSELNGIRRRQNQITLEIVKALVLFATGAVAMHFGVRLMG